MGKYLVHGASRETGKNLEMVVDAASAESAANTAADRGLLVARVERHAEAAKQPAPTPEPAAPLVVRCAVCSDGEMQRVRSSRFGDAAWFVGAAAITFGGLVGVIGLVVAAMMMLSPSASATRNERFLEEALVVLVGSCMMLAVASVGGIAASQRRDWVCKRCSASIPCGEVPPAVIRSTPQGTAR